MQANLTMSVQDFHMKKENITLKVEKKKILINMQVVSASKEKLEFARQMTGQLYNGLT